MEFDIRRLRVMLLGNQVSNRLSMPKVTTDIRHQIQSQYLEKAEHLGKYNPTKETKGKRLKVVVGHH